jgi:hypothetical protein
MELQDWHMWWKRYGAAELRAILMDEWDPIGVRGIPEAADEYDSYLGQLGSRLRADAPAADIAAFLTEAEEVHMGLGHSATSRNMNEALARRLKAWHAAAMIADAP